MVAWSGIDTAGAVWQNLESIPIRQGSQTWRAQMHSMRKDWALCGLQVHGEFPLPIVPWRRSNTLKMGDRLVYAVADPDDGEPRLAWTELIDVFIENKRFYTRAFIWTATLDPSLSHEYSFAFDREGRLAGILEPLPELPNLAALLPGEFAGCLAERCWVDTLLTHGVPQLLDEYERDPDSYEAEAQCGVALALAELGNTVGAIQALRRAIAKDPRNPWPQRTLAGMLSPDRVEEARALLQRAGELEAQEPEEASSHGKGALPDSD